MQIQINAPHQAHPDAFVDFIERNVEEALAEFADRLTRVEVHFQDLNADKGGIDKRCLLEARPRGLGPLTAESDGAESKEAFQSALKKLHRVLDHRFGKLDSRERRAR